MSNEIPIGAASPDIVFKTRPAGLRKRGIYRLQRKALHLPHPSQGPIGRSADVLTRDSKV